MRATRWAAVALTTAAASLLAACGQVPTAGPDPTAAESTPHSAAPAEQTVPAPTDGPTAMPSEATDNQSTNIVAGRITIAGDGCVTLETDDQVQYALVGEPRPPVGATALVTLGETPTGTVSCPGTPASIAKFQIVG